MVKVTREKTVEIIQRIPMREERLTPSGKDRFRDFDLGWSLGNERVGHIGFLCTRENGSAQDGLRNWLT